jgi:hypothetical protein
MYKINPLEQHLKKPITRKEFKEAKEANKNR